MIEISDLSVNYGKNNVLNHINLRILEGDSIIIMGPNGSGKTTLLKAIMGLVNFDGTILLDKKDLRKMPRIEIARYVSYVPQIFTTQFSFTVKEFVSMGLYRVRRDWWDEQDKIEESLRITNIYDIKDKYINNISGGELQKCLIARSLVQDSKFIAMDEPMSHLDVKAVLEISNIISSLSDKGKGIILISHDVNILRNLKGNILLLKNGKIKFFGKEEDDNFLNSLEETFEVRVHRNNSLYYFTKI